MLNASPHPIQKQLSPQKQIGRRDVNVLQTVQRKPFPHFSGSALFNALSEFDFTEIGKSTMRHNQIIYGSCIVSRILAASTRSWNEVREHGLRDILGWTFWFYATPMVQRLFLKAFAPEEARPLIIHLNATPLGEGLLGRMKKLLWRINPLIRWHIPSTIQLKERQAQMIEVVAKEAGGKATELFKKVEPHLLELTEKAIRWRNYSSFFGNVITIALLGIGIPLINIYMTRMNLQKSQGTTGHPLSH